MQHGQAASGLELQLAQGPWQRLDQARVQAPWGSARQCQAQVEANFASLKVQAHWQATEDAAETAAAAAETAHAASKQRWQLELQQ